MHSRKNNLPCHAATLRQRLLPLLPLLTLPALHLFAATALSATAPATAPAPLLNAPVGHTSTGALVTPVNQIVTPAGRLVDIAGMRPQNLALSPDGKILVLGGSEHEILVINPATGKILQHVRFPSDKNKNHGGADEGNLNAKTKSVMGMNGIAFSPDGARLYLSSTYGEIKVFSVATTGKVSALRSIVLPPVPAGATSSADEIPAAIAVSRDGKKLYVALNRSNGLAEIDADTGKILRAWDTGVAPYDVRLAKDKIYVSNWGGRRPDATTAAATAATTGPAGAGATVRVDERTIASEGSITVIDLARKAAGASSSQVSGQDAPPAPASPAALALEIPIGRHASALALSPDARWLVAAATGDDMLYVIDTRTDAIAEKISARVNPGDLFGAQPDALAFSPDGKTLYSANGTQNAIAVFRFDPADKESAFAGLIPAGWFPCGIAFDAQQNQLCVANAKDITIQPEEAGRGASGSGFSTKQFCGTLSLIPVPAAQSALDAHTRRALANLRYPLLTQAALPPRPDRAPVPVPDRSGEPSVFKHVIYIIKENRTYDQVLGDIATGNGAPNLCAFGQRVTPNQHKLARDFVLLDNTYCSGAISADGHNWVASAIATDYVERQFSSDWPRSYTSVGNDALASSPAGFIWNAALARGKTVVNFGELCPVLPKRWKDPARKGKIDFTATYRDYTTGENAIVYGSKPQFASLLPISDPGYVGWDLTVPDVWRARYFINALKKYEQNDNLPDLVILYLPNDHTSGAKPGQPIPEAMVADNDLAMGQVIEALCRTKYWKDTCVFAIEDDSQNGWDHVSGYRTTAYVVSAYTKRGVTIGTQYNNTSLVRTIGLILGIPPMNQMDATATPMFDCFTNTPDFTPFESVPNRVRLDTMNAPDPRKIADAQLRKDAKVSAKLPLDEPDLCDEDTLNRILWRAVKGVAVAYPEWAVKIAGDDD